MNQIHVKKRVIVLGSTGSIGENTLDVIREKIEFFEVAALSCRGNIEKLKRQIQELSPKAVSVTGQSTNLESLREMLNSHLISFYEGEAGQLRMIEECEADIVVNGISGSSGLLPSLRTLEQGKNLALANKETVVMAGPLILEAARKNEVDLIPIDSEHYALFQMLKNFELENVKEIILTASGGAFRDLTYENLQNVRVKDALHHPNWRMGPKITVDSATMANKGLEFIEAHFLYGFETSRIKVVIHPQSFVHSFIRTIDGFLYAQISRPDMRMSIHNALTFPALKPADFGDLDLSGTEFTFYPVDKRKYKMLDLACQATEREGAYPIVYNAANEVAVEKFLKERISFLDIASLVEETLGSEWDSTPGTVDEILSIDRLARERAEGVMKKIKRTV